MAFKTRRIRRRLPVHPLRKLRYAYIWIQEHLGSLTPKPKRKSYVVGVILVFIAAFVVLKVMIGAYSFIHNFDLGSAIFATGSQLQQDENGYTNIVLLGDGGHVRDGADLIDTIMVASIDYKKNAVSLFSVPRDFYVKGHGIDDGKINEFYRNNKLIMPEGRAFELFPEVASEIVNLNIHYFLRVDFDAFVEVVDALDGIDLEVPKAIDDPYYPNETDDGYTMFKIEEGLQHMNGETALKYVRSRKTTSDFDRAARQQLVLQAIQDKALSKGILTKPSVIKALYGAVRKNINTNMTLREMISLARFAKDFDRTRLIAKVIHDDPGQDGGFLYTPERQYYNGQFVLIPFGDNFSLIHKYADLIFHKREAFFEPLAVEVLNATKTPKIAGNLAYQLNRFGFSVGDVENLYDRNGERTYLDKSVIRYYNWKEGKNGEVIPDNPVFLEALQGFVKAEVVPGDPTLARNADVTIILGADYDIFTPGE